MAGGLEPRGETETFHSSNGKCRRILRHASSSVMKRLVILYGMAMATSISICFAVPTADRQKTSRQTETAIVRLEKIVTEAFKNKQVETFKKYLAPDFVGLDPEGFKNVDAE